LKEEELNGHEFSPFGRNCGDGRDDVEGRNEGEGWNDGEDETVLKGVMSARGEELFR
jgi:hypothetical protein